MACNKKSAYSDVEGKLKLEFGESSSSQSPTETGDFQEEEYAEGNASPGPDTEVPMETDDEGEGF